MTNYRDAAAHPVTRATAKLELAHKDVARLDAWTRDRKNEESDDWEYQLRQLRLAQARVRRMKVVILRLDRALYGADFDYEAAMAKVRGLRAWCNRPAWRR